MVDRISYYLRCEGIERSVEHSRKQGKNEEMKIPLQKASYPPEFFNCLSIITSIKMGSRPMPGAVPKRCSFKLIIPR